MNNSRVRIVESSTGAMVSRSRRKLDLSRLPPKEQRQAKRLLRQSKRSQSLTSMLRDINASDIDEYIDGEIVAEY